MYYNGEAILAIQRIDKANLGRQNLTSCGTVWLQYAKGYNMTESAMKLDLSFVTGNEIETVVEKLLFVLGFQCSLVGTDFLAEAIVLKYYNDKMSCSEIYKEIAAKHSTTHFNVEHAIRHAISNCRNEGGLKNFNVISGCNVVDRKFNTTNSELISIVSKWLHWNR